MASPGFLLSFEGVLSGVVAAFLFSSLAFLAKGFIVEPNRKRRRRAAVLGFSVRDVDFTPTLIVGATDSVRTGIYMRPTVGYGSLLAVAYVAQVVGDVSPVSSRGDNLEVFLDGDQVATKSLSRDDEHNILIGGPQRNGQTRDFLDGLNSDLKDGRKILIPSRRFAPSNGSMRSQSPGEAFEFSDDPDRKRRSLRVDGYEYVAHLASDPDRETDLESPAGIRSVAGTDYGLIVRSNAPADAGRVVVLAGVHTFGSAGASLFLAQLAKIRGRRILAPRGRRNSVEHYRDALNYLSGRTNQDLALVVRAQVKEGMLISARLVAAWEIQDCRDPE